VRYNLKLYTAGNAANSLRAVKNLDRFVTKYIPNNCDIEIIDILKDPHMAFDNNIIAVPALVKTAPGPSRKIIGDLSEIEKVLEGLGINPKNKKINEGI